MKIIDSDVIFKHRENIMKQLCEHCNYSFFLFEPRKNEEKSLQVRLAAFCPNCGKPEKKKKIKGKERK